ncbi:MAG: hypothetical protein AB1716_15965 [Planctomycetota bacterium]
MVDLATKRVVLDNLVGLALSPEQATVFHNDLHARVTLWIGLDLLYRATRRLENTLRPDFPNGCVEVVWGNIPGIPLQLLARTACYFDWYSVSAANFVGLTGWIAQTAGLTTVSANEYRRSVIPLVLKHRNKVGAHFSRFKPEEDGRALQEASTFRQLGLVNGRFWANYMYFTHRAAGTTTNSRDLPPWCLSATHEELQGRYGEPPAP